MENEKNEVKTVSDFEFTGDKISLVHPATGKDTFVLLNGQHTDLHQLAAAVHVSDDEAKEFLSTDSVEKPVKLESSLEKAKLRLICLVGFAGSRIVNQQKTQ